MPIIEPLNDIPNSFMPITLCRHCEYENGNYCHHPRLYGYIMFVRNDDFCSRGQRRVDEAGRDIYGNIKRADNATDATRHEDLPQNDDPFDEWGGA